MIQFIIQLFTNIFLVHEVSNELISIFNIVYAIVPNRSTDIIMHEVNFSVILSSNSRIQRTDHGQLPRLENGNANAIHCLRPFLCRRRCQADIN